jgi:hypothetical protein
MRPIWSCLSQGKDLVWLHEAALPTCENIIVDPYQLYQLYSRGDNMPRYLQEM